MLKKFTFWDWHKDWASALRHGPWFRVRREYRGLDWRYFGWRPWRMLKYSGYFPELWYYVKCRLWRRYHVLKCPYIAPTYHDWTYSFIYFMFQMLVDEVEKDRWLTDRAYYIPDDDPGQAWDFRDEWQEVATLYDWWLNVRPAMQQAEADSLTRWHDEHQRLGGMTFGEPRQDGSSQLIFPSDRGQDMGEERRLLQAHADIEAANAAKDEEMMLRLVKMVPYLWT